MVVPERPFSITDLVPNLKKQGFRRFIVDLSNAEPSKGLYRDIARAVDQGSSLLNTTRFNWKEGFWSEETIRRDASKDDSKDASINKKPKSPPYAQRRQSRTR